MFPAIISGYRFLYLQLAALVGFGWAIVVLSFICSFLMLPLMRAVAGVVRREKEYEDVIDPQVAAIKAKYASDMDRHLRIQALYRRYDYSPLAPIKKVLPLFVQIPFLLLTYYMLKGTAELSGVKFLFLRDLGRPDALIPVLHANLLPIVMTAVNIVTVFSTPDFTKKDWLQAIGVALLFLVLLYAAPSALLLYWTLNNVMTMIRTLTGRQGAGGRLLLCRIGGLGGLLAPDKMRAMIAGKGRVLSAGAVLLLLLLACYMFTTSHSLVVITDQASRFTYKVCYDLMLAVLLLAFLPMGFLLWKDRTAFRWPYVTSLLAMVGVAGGLFAIRVFSVELYHGLKLWLNRFLIFEILLVFALVPLFVRRRIAFDGLVHELKEVFACEWHLLLLPLALSAHYALAGENLLPSMKTIGMLAAYMLFPCILGVVVAGVLFRCWISAKTLARLFLGCMIGLYLIPLISTESGVLSYDRNIVIRLAVIAGSAVFFVRMKSVRILRVFLLIFLMAACFRLAVSMATKATTHGVVSMERRTVEQLEDAKCIRHNNIYFLVFDSYAHQKLQKSICSDGGQTQRFLSSNAFTIYDAYSVGWHTTMSMSRVFSLGGVSGGSECSTIGGDNPYGDFLRKVGYKTSYMLNGYIMPTAGERMPGDYYFPTPSGIVPQEKILYACILRGVMSRSANVFNYYTHSEWVARKRELIDCAETSNNFIYAHASLPDHTNRLVRDPEGDASAQRSYAARLKLAQDELEEDVRRIVKRDKDAVVIVASDHGPSLFMSDLADSPDARHLLDAYGIFLAIRWPTDYKPCLRLTCLQNVMLEVLIYLTGKKSLARFASDGATLPWMDPMKFPSGAVLDGVIQVGVDKGLKFP